MKILQYLKRALNLAIIFIMLMPLALPAQAVTLAQRLSGRILLQVQSSGEAWYVNPVNLQRYYLGRPDDAFRIMRELGLGITNTDLAKIPESTSNLMGDTALRKRLSGRILLQVQSHGEAWYVYPVNLKRYYLGRPADAFRIMRELGLGITNSDLSQIPVAPTSGFTPPSPPLPAPPPVTSRQIPSFIYTVRAFWGNDTSLDDFQLDAVRDLGLQYIHNLPVFFWGEAESGPQGGVMKWGKFDEQMNKLAARGLKVIPFLQTPKLAGLHWNQSILRTDPRYRQEYSEYAYEVVNRYKNHSAWSGVVAVWGGSSDIWRDDTGAEISFNQPDVVIPLLNAAYDGIKRADPNTIVIGFNMGADVSAEDWEQWHRRAFALSPRFDWFGVQTHSTPVGVAPSASPYRGVLGLANVRRFLSGNGYSQKPIFLNEGGFPIFDSLFNEQSQAEQVVETFVAASANSASLNLKGWVYFDLFGGGGATTENRCGVYNDGDNYGIMTCSALQGQPQPRPAYRALQTLFTNINFPVYNYEATLSGSVNQATPFVYRFARANNPSSKFWVVFSPRTGRSEPASQSVSINIAPAMQATRIDLFGNQTTVQADSNGNLNILAAASPVYIKVGQ